MNKLASALATGLLVIGLAPMTVLANSGAPNRTTGGGTWDDCNTNAVVTPAGSNLKVTVHIDENYYGLLNGTYSGTEHDLVHADGSASFIGSGTFTGAVAGHSGTAGLVYWGAVSPTGILPATGPDAGRWVLIGRTGGLRGVVAIGNWGAQFLDVSDACDAGIYGGDYSGTVIAR